MIKIFNIVILISTLLIITFSSCNKESTLPIQNENQNSTNELKSLVSQVKFWHDSIVSNKTKGVNSENNIKSFNSYSPKMDRSFFLSKFSFFNCVKAKRHLSLTLHKIFISNNTP